VDAGKSSQPGARIECPRLRALEVLPGAEDAIYMVEIADAIFESINTRRMVQVA